jgi:hypothetical protein
MVCLRPQGDLVDTLQNVSRPIRRWRKSRRAVIGEQVRRGMLAPVIVPPCGHLRD